MAYQQPVPGNRAIDHKVTHLPVHLTHRLFAHFEIIRGITIQFRTLSAPIFDIRHVDIHNTLKQFQGSNILVTAAIIHNRQSQTLLSSNSHGLNKMRRVMGRSNKINIVAADTLEPEHAVCQLLFGDWIPFALMADIIILAVHTA